MIHEHYIYICYSLHCDSNNADLKRFQWKELSFLFQKFLVKK